MAMTIVRTLNALDGVIAALVSGWRFLIDILFPVPF